MAKLPDWVRREDTGRLIYRRAYPAALRPFLANPGQRELKVPLGDRYSVETDQAWRTYTAAKRRFDAEVSRARALRHAREKQAAGLVDRLTPDMIAHLAGMRLGEIAGMRLMDLEDREGTPAFNIRPYEGRRLKNAESRREVPVHPELVALDLLRYAEGRRKTAKADELLFPDAKANIRGQWGAKLSEWFVTHLRDHDITGTKLGFHSFRHNFEDRLRAIKLHGTPIGLRLTGRKVAGSAGTYGDGFTLADRLEALEQVMYPGLELSHLKPSAN